MNINEVKRRLPVQIWMDFGIWLVFRYVVKYFEYINFESFLFNELTVICAQLLSRVRFFATPWTAACQAPLSMVFPRQEYCSGLPFPPLEDLLDPRIKPKSLTGPDFFYH